MHFRFFLLQEVVHHLQLLPVLKDVALLHQSFIVAEPSATVVARTTSIISSAFTKLTHFSPYRPCLHLLFLHRIHLQNHPRTLHHHTLPFLVAAGPFIIARAFVVAAFVIIITFADLLIFDFGSSFLLFSE